MQTKSKTSTLKPKKQEPRRKKIKLFMPNYLPTVCSIKLKTREN